MQSGLGHAWFENHNLSQTFKDQMNQFSLWLYRMDLVQARETKLTEDLWLTLLHLSTKFGVIWIYGVLITAPQRWGAITQIP